MGREQQTDAKPPLRGLLARPLDALVFLLPLIAFYELATPADASRVIAFDFLRRFLLLFGPVGFYAPALAVVTILLATHVASHGPWVIRWKRVGLMYIEAAVGALPLLALKRMISLSAPSLSITSLPESNLVDRIAPGIGAGVYEELVFRLLLVSLIVMIGADLFRLNRRGVAFTAVILSSLAFAAHHHYPIGAEPFDAIRFAFRSAAGVYLALIFWLRGYGPAAGCHAAYNVALATMT